VTLQIVASLTDDTRSVNYDRNKFIIQATGAYPRRVHMKEALALLSNFRLGQKGLAKTYDLAYLAFSLVTKKNI
jgi:hypothetical protein